MQLQYKPQGNTYCVLQKKINKWKKTGSAGGTESKLIDVDNVVLDIGRESPAVVGLNCSESWQDESAFDQSRQVIGNDDSPASHLGNSTRPASSCATDMYKQKSSRSDQMSHAANNQDDERLLRSKKLKLQVELLEKGSYLKSLQILKLERELGIPASHFTKDFPVESQTIYLLYEGCVNENGVVNEQIIQNNVNQ
ncbi:hypothetical protein PR048_020012 [Dryococelus australis]|uniref:Uncharacterized protein n=1 Tax=Dryococelus australis TaxID=614101 RepID=A0ABQ9H538_9NEOP|nr:hypothetical protein PR048_020012 [Dryococelus australis]